MKLLLTHHSLVYPLSLGSHSSVFLHSDFAKYAGSNLSLPCQPLLSLFSMLLLSKARISSELPFLLPCLQEPDHFQEFLWDSRGITQDPDLWHGFPCWTRIQHQHLEISIVLLLFCFVFLRWHSETYCTYFLLSLSENTWQVKPSVAVLVSLSFKSPGNMCL